MNINSYIYYAPRLEIRDVGIDTDITKSPDTIRKEVTAKLKANPYSSPLSSDLILYNKFNLKDQGTGTSILAYYFQSLLGSNGALSVYKKAPEDSFYTYICDMYGNYSMLDYNIKANAFYHYLVAYRQSSGSYKMYEDTIVNLDGTTSPAYISTKWDSWTICDIEETETEKLYVKTGNIWKLRYNMGNGELTQNNSISTWDTLGQFPKYSKGKKDYMSSTVTCLLGDISDYLETEAITKEENRSSITTFKVKTANGYTERVNKEDMYSREVEKYNAWREFINNSSLKLLKDYKGNSWVIQVTSAPTYNINMQSNLLQTTISFSWQEALDVDSISIVSSAR